MVPHRERSESQIQTDVTIYGATSFVARHVLNYLIDVGPTLPRKLKVTLAGRNETKLNKLLNTFTPIVVSRGQYIALDIFVANSTDHVALNKMTNRTRVIINCAGPFELYSNGVVKSCTDNGTDYVDITGEAGWVGNMRTLYGSNAAKSGSRIISMCGFDSIPSDISIFAAVQALREATSKNINNSNNTNSNNNNNNNQQQPLEIETARTWHAIFGQAGGGTLATMANMKIDFLNCLFHKKSNNMLRLRKVPLMIFDPLVLTHPETIRYNPDYEGTRNRMAWSEWLNCLPFPHTIFKQGVSIPFFMAVVNAKVVQASALALNYGPKFTYMERFLPLGFDLTLGFGLFSAIPSLIVLWFMSISVLILKIPILSSFLLKIFAPPGTGASDEMCEKGYAKVYAEVKAPLTSNRSGRVACANCYMEFQGDPGNYITAQCVVEAALSLVLQRKELPTRSKDGFGTPAELLGPVILMRLKDTKVRPVKIKTNVRLNERDHEYKVYM